ncbi:hypothetical protein RFI_21173 [Reticulomyxa filosa]|uniref:Uncharacterized protein n=1 Tax=Reticulomyxa filosa TaxID=46433 RepID=X6MQA4_RETFI|nr:hypothetical protein RFI_21173 [Reticulomyxa filosa]|eukprot:ETO16183.1 hypothetical protein RFI_21173 [Reticulomyxa filosa]
MYVCMLHGVYNLNFHLCSFAIPPPFFFFFFFLKKKKKKRKQIQKLFKDKTRMIRDQIENDDMISSSKLVAKVRKAMLPTTRRTLAISRRASYARISSMDHDNKSNANTANQVVATKTIKMLDRRHRHCRHKKVW